MTQAAAAHPQDLRAAEYALGVLEGAPLAEARSLIANDAGFAGAVETWELELAVLAEGVAPVTPPARVWPAIDARIPGRPANDAWGNLGLWRGLTAASLVVAAVSVTMLAIPRPGPVVPPPVQIAAASPYVALVSDLKGGPSLAAVTFDPDLKRMVITPVSLSEEQAKSLELWVVPAGGGAPQSLGLIKAGSPVVLTDFVLPVDAKGAAIAISREPLGGSPNGSPTVVLGAGPLGRA